MSQALLHLYFAEILSVKVRQLHLKNKCIGMFKGLKSIQKTTNHLHSYFIIMAVAIFALFQYYTL